MTSVQCDRCGWSTIAFSGDLLVSERKGEECIKHEVIRL